MLSTVHSRTTLQKVRPSPGFCAEPIRVARQYWMQGVVQVNTLGAWRGAGFVVDGLDIEPAFVRIARQKHPEGRFFEADMSDFRLPQQYDVVMCLFSSIGYLKTVDRVLRAFVCFRQHLLQGGLIVVEPWFEPGVLDPQRVSRNVGNTNDICVTRTGRVELEPELSRLYFDYEISGPKGTRHASEVHELGLFTRDELMEAFRSAGLQADYDPMGLTNRGLYIAHSLPITHLF